MRFENVGILALTHIDAPNVILSQTIEDKLAHNLERFGMNPNFIQHLAGVDQRRVYPPGRTPSKYAAEVGLKALEQANLQKADIDLLINCSIYKDYIEPATAAIIHGRLGLAPDTFSFDVGNACLGFITGMCVAGQMIERQTHDHILLTSCETAGDLLEETLDLLANPDIEEDDFRMRFATLTLGSAATAIVLGDRRKHPNAPIFRGGVTLAATDQSHLCVGENEDIRTDAKGLLLEGTALARRTYAKAKEELAWEDGQFDHYFLHQVGRVHNQAIVDQLNVPADRAPEIFQEYGNTGSNTITLNLSRERAAGRLKPGEKSALLAIGSGINCAMMEIHW